MHWQSMVPVFALLIATPRFYGNGRLEESVITGLPCKEAVLEQLVARFASTALNPSPRIIKIAPVKS